MSRKKKKDQKSVKRDQGAAPVEGLEGLEENAEISEFIPAADEVFMDESYPAIDEVEFGEGDVMEDDRDAERNDTAPSRNADVEAAEEVAPVSPATGRDGANEDEGAREGHGLGTVSIILSILAFFIVPFLLGSAGIILGVISARRGSALGWWAVGIGAVAVILTAFVRPIAGY
ncbi:hypothetical protein GXN76_10755 [Kroppenstedtia pulmonis]|uniref:DUF4190 domain-containing protein n=1 Tax=Kroppenstedtia pulmonis TaxID=1380685 RepID=A0A7D3Y0Z7_9BACL|nr:hypothetical protein [Kroppenstedtia pulmonis]QKG84900.1 hypothetical protein GXN76_10755 [Kroppenstedtia pulmonis]